MKSSALKHRAVVSMPDGLQIGQVEDVLFDTSVLCAAAFAVTGSGGRSILTFQAAHIGADAITIDSAAAAQAQVAAEAMDATWRAFSDLTHLKVMDGAGTDLGAVREIEFDDQNGRISQLEVHRGGVAGLGGTSVTIAAVSIRGVGPQLITVDTPPPTPEPMPPT